MRIKLPYDDLIEVDYLDSDFELKPLGEVIRDEVERYVLEKSGITDEGTGLFEETEVSHIEVREVTCIRHKPTKGRSTYLVGFNIIMRPKYE